MFKTRMANLPTNPLMTSIPHLMLLGMLSSLNIATVSKNRKLLYLYNVITETSNHMKTLKNIFLALVGTALIGEYLYQSHEPISVILFVCAMWLGYCVASIFEKK